MDQLKVSTFAWVTCRFGVLLCEDKRRHDPKSRIQALARFSIFVAARVLVSDPASFVNLELPSTGRSHPVRSQAELGFRVGFSDGISL